MDIVDFLKLYLAGSYRKKLSSWGDGAMLFVKMDFILSLSAIFSPIAILISILVFGDFVFVVITVPFLGWGADLFLTRKFSVYDDIEKVNVTKSKLVNFLMFVVGVIGIIISSQLVIYFYPQ